MNWIVLLVVLICVTIAAVVYAKKTFYSDSFAPFIVATLAIFATIICALTIIVGRVQTPQSINAFTKQKAYIESHETTNPVEDAALTAKKIELNEWLYDAQLSKSRFGGWSFYPDSIFNLEPIE